MGYNTVAFLLNDLMHTLEKSPKTVAWAISHPPHSERELTEGHWRKQVDSVSRDAGEPLLHHQALELLPTFHADWKKFLFAGRNCIHELKFIKFSKDRKTGKKTIVLEMPDWMDRP